MADLTVNEYGPEMEDFGVNFVAADVLGDKALNADGMTQLAVRNDSASPTDVTITTPKTLAGGAVTTGIAVVNVPAGDTFIGMGYLRNVFNEDSMVEITCNPITTIFVQAFKPKSLSN